MVFFFFLKVEKYSTESTEAQYQESQTDANGQKAPAQMARAWSKQDIPAKTKRGNAPRRQNKSPKSKNGHTGTHRGTWETTGGLGGL